MMPDSKNRKIQSCEHMKVPGGVRINGTPLYSIYCCYFGNADRNDVTRKKDMSAIYSENVQYCTIEKI